MNEEQNTWIVVANTIEKYDIRTARLTDIVLVRNEQEQWRMDAVLKRISTFAYRLSACKSIQKVKHFSEQTKPLTIEQFEQKYA